MQIQSKEAQVMHSWSNHSRLDWSASSEKMLAATTEVRGEWKKQLFIEDKNGRSKKRLA